MRNRPRQRIAAQLIVRIMDCSVDHFDVALRLVLCAGTLDTLDFVPTGIGSVSGVELLLRDLRPEIAAPVAAQPTPGPDFNFDSIADARYERRLPDAHHRLPFIRRHISPTLSKRRRTSQALAVSAVCSSDNGVGLLNRILLTLASTFARLLGGTNTRQMALPVVSV